MRTAQVETATGKRLVQVPDDPEQVAAAESQPGFVGWADGNTRVPLANGGMASVPSGQIRTAMADPMAAPVVDAPRPMSDLERIALHNGRSAMVPKGDAPAALRDPMSAGGSAMRSLVDRPNLPTASEGAWTPPPGWAEGGAKLRALQSMSAPNPWATKEIVANPDTGGFAVSELGTMPEGRIRLPPGEYAGLLASETAISDQQDAEDAKREALMALEQRTRIPAPILKRAMQHPAVQVSTVGQAPAMSMPVDLASLAPPNADVSGGAVMPRTATASRKGTVLPAQAPSPLADGLAREQLLATLQKGGAGLSRAGARMAAALAGLPPPDDTTGTDNTTADQRVKDYVQRMSMADEDRKRAAEASLKDPASPESKRFQAAISKVLPPGLYSPEEIASMTAADASMVTDFAKMKSTLMERAKQAEEDRKSRESIAKDNRDARSEDARQRSLDRALSRQLAAETRQDALGQREDLKQQDFERRMAERNVGGYEIDPSNPPTADGAKNMANVVRHKDEILGSLDRLENMVKTNGSEMFGTKAGEMASEWMNVTNRLRGLNEMGVPNGKDYEMLAKQLVDPTSWEATTTSKARMLQQIKSLRNQMDRTTAATANAYKFKPAGGGQAVSASVPTTEEDSEAVSWARSNPSDPRAVEILQSHGIEL